LKKPKSVKQILGSQTSGLKELLHYCQQLSALNIQLSNLLPPPLSLHCTAVGVKQQTLILVTDSPVWATRLRLQSLDLIKALKEFQLKSVIVNIQPRQKTPEFPPRARPKMSSDTSNLLNNIAETTGDLKLKQALQRLARRSQ